LLLVLVLVLAMRLCFVHLLVMRLHSNSTTWQPGGSCRYNNRSRRVIASMRHAGGGTVIGSMACQCAGFKPPASSDCRQCICQEPLMLEHFVNHLWLSLLLLLLVWGGIVRMGYSGGDRGCAHPTICTIPTSRWCKAAAAAAAAHPAAAAYLCHHRLQVGWGGSPRPLQQLGFLLPPFLVGLLLLLHLHRPLEALGALLHLVTTSVQNFIACCLIR
jgi:hypothetical protein